MRRKRRLHDERDDGQIIGLLDVIALLAVAVLLIAIRALPFINEPPRDVAEKRTPTEPIPLFVEMHWEKGPHDVDIWQQCTTTFYGREETYNINYLQKHEKYLDLVWDDLGGGEQNYERITSNSLVDKMPPNTICRMNAHLYSIKGGAMPIKGRLVIVLNKDSSAEKMVTPQEGVHFELTFGGHELSIARVHFDESGLFDPRVSEFFPTLANTCIATCKR